MTKTQMRAALEQAAQDLGLTGADAWKMQSVHQFLAARMVLDAAGVKDAAARKAGWGALVNAHSGMGCNASQTHQWTVKVDKVQEQAQLGNVKV